MSGYPPRRPPPLGRPPKPPAPVETSEQMHARWEREAEADEIAVTLGLAFRGETQGISYWRGDGSAFRAGYWAGKDAPRCAQDLIDRQAVGSVARYVAYRPCGCFQGFADVGVPHLNKSAGDYIARWVRDGCIVKPMPADAFYATGPCCPEHAYSRPRTDRGEPNGQSSKG